MTETALEKEVAVRVGGIKGSLDLVELDARLCDVDAVGSHIVVGPGEIETGGNRTQPDAEAGRLLLDLGAAFQGKLR